MRSYSAARMNNRLIDGIYWVAVGVGSVAGAERAWRGRYLSAVAIFALIGVVAWREAWTRVRPSPSLRDAGDEPDWNLELMRLFRLAVIAMFGALLAIRQPAEGHLWTGVVAAIIGLGALRNWSHWISGKRQ